MAILNLFSKSSNQTWTKVKRLVEPDGNEMCRDDVRNFRLQLNEKIKVAERLKTKITKLTSKSLALQRTEQ